MMPLSSTLESYQNRYTEVRSQLEEQQFSLGGNWDYTSGSFDRALDDANKVWLRLPFQVISGSIDDSSQDTDAVIRLGTPYVLKHLYNEGNDPEAKAHLVGALFDQFQTPVDPDANIEPKWLDQAKEALSEAERILD
ncbi:YugN family protein [Paenibacillus gorillae]|uniref:YugN family protein n=1 Tax=Paenibacillus gorillae TaxID=1243662 RepID=UPI0004B6B3D4|nr:YugN family protein [Paenibacillus gorillae]